MEREEILWPMSTPHCSKCDRDALTVDAKGNALCGRHATIFMTLERMKDSDSETVAEPQHLTPA